MTPSGTRLASDGEVSALSLDLSYFYDIGPLDAPVVPYIGGTLGLTSLTVDNGSLDGSADALKLRAVAGATFKLGGTELFIEGGFENIGPASVQTTIGSTTVEDDFNVSGFVAAAGVRIPL